MGFGSLGISELIVIFIIVLVFFGPRRFPEIARSMGSAMREFRRSLNQIQRELEEADPRKDLPGRELLDEIRSAKAGNWLDPNRPRTPEAPDTGARQPQQTGEAAGSSGGDGGPQLPMFEGEEPAEPHPDAPPTDDSRSG